MMRNRPKVTHIVYGYDAEGRLSAVSCGGFTVNYAYNGHYGMYMCCYDAQGWLLFKDSPNGGDYLWDGWRMVKKQAWPWGGFGETVEYVWGKDLSGTAEGAGGVGGLLAVRVDGAWHFPLYDHNGIKRAQSPSRKAQGDRDFKATPKEWSEERYPATQRQLYIVAYVDSTGAVSAEYAYDPFGKVVSHTGMDFDFQFSTKFYDPDIGMYYYGYRYYSPELRRWASRDPIGEEGGLNLYGFCGNDGVNVYDSVGYKGVRLVSLEYPEAIDNEFLGPESDVELDNLDSIKQVAVVTPEITGGGTDIRGVKIITDSFGYICELRIMIRIVYHFPTGSGNNDSGTVFYYYAHKLGNDKLGVANIMITDQIIEHERGHAKAFLQFYPKLKRDLETYIGKFSLWRKTAIRERFKSNIHYRTYKLFSARYANEATVHYLDTHGWIRIPNFTPNSKFGLSHGETDYAWRKK